MTRHPFRSAPPRKLFGTDGIRGKAGRYPLDPDTVEKLGGVVVGILKSGAGPLRILIGRDTRESGKDLEAALCDGIFRAGGCPVRGGILPTPAIAYLTAAGSFQAGIMISASHNSYEDNGIKIFSREGYKLEDRLEAEIEAGILLERQVTPGHQGLPGESAGEEMRQRYLSFLLKIAPKQVDYKKIRIAIDCANGAASRIAPLLFSSLGMEIHSISTQPSGRNINEECGSVHPDKVQRLTRKVGADLGVALDGDADRAIFSAPTGEILDGDHVLFLTALSWKRRNLLKGNAIVSTVMANQWLENSLAREGIEIHRTDVGDRNVLTRMRDLGCNLGGEPSGHIIFHDHSSTGDGLLTTLMFLEAVHDLGIDLADWTRSVRKYPQRLVNIDVTCKPSLREHPEIGPAIGAAEERLSGSGRILVRYSGTEPKVRIMVEAESSDLLEKVINQISPLLRKHLSISNDPAPKRRDDPPKEAR